MGKFLDLPEHEFFLSGATANSYYYEYSYGGNPGNYQTFFAGMNDICGIGFALGGLREIQSVFDEEIIKGSQDYNRKLDAFRDETVMNTYGESAPFEGDLMVRIFQDMYTKDVSFGPDRILLRPLLKDF